MRYLVFILGLLISFSAFAQSEKFSYEGTAIKLGLNVVSIGAPWTFPGVHRLYTDKNFRRAMMVMENVEGKKSKLTITETKKYIIVEYPVSANTFNSLAFVNITKLQLETFIFKQESTVYTKFEKFMTIFISSAHANEVCEIPDGDTMAGSSLSGLSSFYSSEYFQMASSCLMGILEGVWESTGGMAVSAWEGLKHLATNPVDFWDEKIEQFNKLKAFLSDFQTNMQKIFASFQKLPDITKAQMLCSFVGSIGADVLITVLTAGAGSAKLALSVKIYMTKLLKLEGFFVKLSKLGRITEIPVGFFERITKGLVSEKRLIAIESMAKNDFDELAMQLVRCSL